MRSRVTGITLAAALVAALIGTGPAAALANLPGRMAPRPTANDYQAKQQHYEYDRQERQWGPWGHWGSYYGPMVH